MREISSSRLNPLPPPPPSYFSLVPFRCCRQTCDLVEVDGLSPWVYADGSHSAALVDPAGVLQRGEGAMVGSHLEAERTVVLATLEYEEREQ